MSGLGIFTNELLRESSKKLGFFRVFHEAIHSILFQEKFILKSF